METCCISYLGVAASILGTLVLALIGWNISQFLLHERVIKKIIVKHMDAYKSLFDKKLEALAKDFDKKTDNLREGIYLAFIPTFISLGDYDSAVSTSLILLQKCSRDDAEKKYLPAILFRFRDEKIVIKIFDKQRLLLWVDEIIANGKNIIEFAEIIETAEFS